MTGGSRDLSAVLDALRDSFLASQDAGVRGARYRITIGTATCGCSAGAREVLDAVLREVDELGIDCDVVEVGCSGHCYAEPLMSLARYGERPRVFGYLDAVAARFVLRNHLDDRRPSSKHFVGYLADDGSILSAELAERNAMERRIVLGNCGVVDPCSFEHYVARGGYRALARVVRGRCDDVLETIAASGLRGRGGAGFPTGRKWRLCRDAAGDRKIVICNADEGDPGAFMDRMILESDPHAVLEGLAIAAYAVGAQRGYVYVRAEYPLAVRRMRKAVEDAYEASILGPCAFGFDGGLEVEVLEAAGAFVCGEETALIASLEDERGIPRPRPPYPTQEGLRGLPTLVDNVKTLAYVPRIVEKGASWFASIGDKACPGTAVFALAGSVARPGVVEVDMGSRLRQVIYDAGGGVADPNYEKPGKETPNVGNGGYCTVPKLPDLVLKAVQIGGPSGGCLPADKLDVPVTFDSLEAEGAMMGSGGLIVMSDNDCMVEMARYFLSFTSAQSCGRCVVCRLGLRAMLEILERMVRGEGSEDDLEEVERLGALVRDGSACGLGRTAPNPVLSAVRHFADEYRLHFQKRECPALTCRELISYEFADVGCMSVCDECCVVCDAIVSGVEWDGYLGRAFRTHDIDDDLCTRCAVCVDSCAGVNHRAVRKVTPAKRDRRL